MYVSNNPVNYVDYWGYSTVMPGIQGFMGNNGIKIPDCLAGIGKKEDAPSNDDAGVKIPTAGGHRPPDAPDDAVEHPNRPGKWGEIGPDGRFKEKWRFDEGKPGAPRWEGEDHVHVNGGKEHLPPNTPYPGGNK